MKLERYFTFFLVVFITLALLYLFVKKSGGGTDTAEAAASEYQTQTTAQVYEPKTTGSTDSGDALIELTPLAADKGRMVVQFSINTHSVRLSSFDLKEITRIVFHGKEIKPASADRIGGHHSAGSIVFDTGEDIRDFTIRITGIPRIKDRVYEWHAGS